MARKHQQRSAASSPKFSAQLLCTSSSEQALCEQRYCRSGPATVHFAQHFRSQQWLSGSRVPTQKKRVCCCRPEGPAHSAKADLSQMVDFPNRETPWFKPALEAPASFPAHEHRTEPTKASKLFPKTGTLPTDKTKQNKKKTIFSMIIPVFPLAFHPWKPNKKKRFLEFPAFLAPGPWDFAGLPRFPLKTSPPKKHAGNHQKVGPTTKNKYQKVGQTTKKLAS